MLVAATDAKSRTAAAVIGGAARPGTVAGMDSAMIAGRLAGHAPGPRTLEACLAVAGNVSCRPAPGVTLPRDVVARMWQAGRASSDRARSAAATCGDRDLLAVMAAKETRATVQLRILENPLTDFEIAMTVHDRAGTSSDVHRAAGQVLVGLADTLALDEVRDALRGELPGPVAAALCKRPDLTVDDLFGIIDAERAATSTRVRYVRVNAIMCRTDVNELPDALVLAAFDVYPPAVISAATAMARVAVVDHLLETCGDDLDVLRGLAERRDLDADLCRRIYDLSVAVDHPLLSASVCERISLHPNAPDDVAGRARLNDHTVPVLAHLLRERTGDDATAWSVAVALGADWEGTIGDLVATAAEVSGTSAS